MSFLNHNTFQWLLLATSHVFHCNAGPVSLCSPRTCFHLESRSHHSHLLQKSKLRLAGFAKLTESKGGSGTVLAFQFHSRLLLRRVKFIPHLRSQNMIRVHKGKALSCFIYLCFIHFLSLDPIGNPSDVVYFTSRYDRLKYSFKLLLS